MLTSISYCFVTPTFMQTALVIVLTHKLPPTSQCLRWQINFRACLQSRPTALAQTELLTAVEMKEDVQLSTISQESVESSIVKGISQWASSDVAPARSSTNTGLENILLSSRGGDITRLQQRGCNCCKIQIQLHIYGLQHKMSGISRILFFCWWLDILQPRLRSAPGRDDPQL